MTSHPLLSACPAAGAADWGGEPTPRGARLSPVPSRSPSSPRGYNPVAGGRFPFRRRATRASALEARPERLRGRASLLTHGLLAVVAWSESSSVGFFGPRLGIADDDLSRGMVR